MSMLGSRKSQRKAEAVRINLAKANAAKAAKRKEAGK
jgi:hypothetical protein